MTAAFLVGLAAWLFVGRVIVHAVRAARGGTRAERAQWEANLRARESGEDA